MIKRIIKVIQLFSIPLLLVIFILGILKINKPTNDNFVINDRNNPVLYKLNNYITKLGLKNTTVTNETIPDMFKYVTDDGKLALYLDEKNLGILVKDLQNGSIWSSYDIHNTYLIDREAPVIKQNKNIKRTYLVNSELPNFKTLVKVVDNLDGDVTLTDEMITHTVNMDQVGTYQVTYDVVDKSGNKNAYSMEIHIVDSIPDDLVEVDDTKDLQFPKKVSDAQIRTLKSGVTIGIYNGTNPLKLNVLHPGVKLSYSKNNKGFVSTVDFTTEKIRFNLEVKIENGELVVHIPKESIEEYNPNLWKPGNADKSLNYIAPFPYFGATTSEEDGYIVLPDGTGAISELKKVPTKKAVFSADVYGKDYGYLTSFMNERPTMTRPLEKITMPIYGIIHDVNHKGFFVVSESGANYATYNFKTTGTTDDYYQSYFSYNYRTSYFQFQSRTDEGQRIVAFQNQVNQFDLTQRYIFLQNEKANYVGMAKQYQNYLLKNDLLGEKNRNASTVTPIKVDIIGNEVEMGLFRPKNTTITSYKESIQILKQLETDGFNHILSSYKTYVSHDEAYRFDIQRTLGGSKDFYELMDYVDKHNIQFSIYTDYVKTYRDDTNKVTANTLGKQSIKDFEFSNMNTYFRITKPKYYSQYARNDIEQFNQYGIEQVNLVNLDLGIFTHYDQNKMINSYENMEDIIGMLDTFKTEQIKTDVSLPFAYMYSYVNNYLDAPLSSSELIFTDATIPFLQLTIGGYMDLYTPYLNFMSNDQYTKLRMVEYGVFPSYILSGSSVYDLKFTNSSNIYVSEYDYLKRRMNETYQFIKEGVDATLKAEMIDHSFIAKGVSLVKYDNGTQIIVNYNQTDFDYNGMIIDAYHYKVIS